MVYRLQIRKWMRENKYFQKTPELLLQFIFYKLITDKGDALSLEEILTEENIEAKLEKIDSEFKRLNNLPDYRGFFTPITDRHQQIRLIFWDKPEVPLSVLPEVITDDFLTELNRLELKRFSPNDWGRIYDSVIDMYNWLQRGKPNSFDHPSPIYYLMARLALFGREDHELSIYDPNMGVGNLLTKSFNQKNQLNGHNTEAYSDLLIQFNFLAHGISENNYQIQLGDPLMQDWHSKKDVPEKFDVVISDLSNGESWSGDKKLAEDYRFKDYPLPPKSMAEYMYILHGLAHLKEDGIMVICLPAGALYRIGLEEQLRKKLVEQHLIESILAVPAKFTNQPRKSSVVMILSKKRSKERTGIYMLDIDDELPYSQYSHFPRIHRFAKIFKSYIQQESIPGWSTVASWEAIAANDYNLTILKYVMSKKPQTDEEKIEYQMSAYARATLEVREGESSLHQLMRNLDEEKYLQMTHNKRLRIEKNKD